MSSADTKPYNINPHGGDIYKQEISMDFSVSLNPFGLPKKVREAIINDIDSVNNYPEYDKASLRIKLAQKLGIDDDKIILTAGASEAFISIARALNIKEGMIFTPCFSGYEYALKSLGAAIEKCPIERIESAVFKKGQLIFIANPNNPTGKCINADRLNNIIEKVNESGAYLVIDECFLPLSRDYNESFINRYRISNNKNYVNQNQISDYQNIFVVRSFTKTFSMPGVRLGYIVTTNGEMADRIAANLPEWNISSIGLTAGKAALDCIDELEEVRAFIEEEKIFITKEFRKLGFDVFESDTNYILFRVNEESCGGEVEEIRGCRIDERHKKSHKQNLLCKLREKGILIRDCSNFDGLNKGYYRIAVRSHKENEELIRICQSFYM